LLAPYAADFGTARTTPVEKLATFLGACAGGIRLPGQHRKNLAAELIPPGEVVVIAYGPLIRPFGLRTLETRFRTRG
jgi:hypothetical protein